MWIKRRFNGDYLYKSRYTDERVQDISVQLVYLWFVNKLEEKEREGVRAFFLILEFILISRLSRRLLLLSRKSLTFAQLYISRYKSIEISNLTRLILGNQAGYYRWIDKFRHDPTAFVCSYQENACLTFRSSPSPCECSCTAYFCPPAVVERNEPIFLYLEHKRYDTRRYVKLRPNNHVTLSTSPSIFLSPSISVYINHIYTTDNVSYRLIRHCLTIEMIHYLSVSKYGEASVRTKYISCSKLL